MAIQTASANELEHEERQSTFLAYLEDLHDVWMLQLGNCHGLAMKASPFGRPGVVSREHHFQRDDPVELRVQGLVDDAHPTSPQFPDDAISGHFTDFVLGS